MVRSGLCLAFAGAVFALGAEGVSPVQKVVELLDGMLATGKAEKHGEEVEFAKLRQWCDSTRQSTSKSIEDGSAQIQQLDASIAKAESDAEVLGQEIAELQGQAAAAKGEADQAQAIRKKEKDDYMTQHQDLSESVDACLKAVSVLKSRSADVPQALMQVSSLRAIPVGAKSVLDAFLAVGDELDAAQAPKANAYEFQSGGVVGLLEKLAARFEDERLALAKAEMNARANFELLLQQLTDNIQTGEARSTEKSAIRATKLSDAAGFKGDTAATENAKAADEKTLSDTTASCAAAAVEFEQNQVTRSEEIKAIEQAVQILTSDSVAGHAETHLPSLAQVRSRGAALAQLRSSAQARGDVREKASSYLQGRARALGSRYLSVMAARVAEDPFGKVKAMIKYLITKLMEEANAEADHHAYCTSELATNQQTREEKSADVERLSAQADQLTATGAQLAGEIAELSASMAEVQVSRAQATSNREAEKKANTQTIADAKEAQVAVEQAVAALRSFYDKSASLLQAKRRGSSASGHGAPYTGMSGESGGVLGLLDVILSDFARLETETSSTEDQAQAAHDRFMSESEQDLAVKDTTKGHKEGNRQQSEEALSSTQKELSLTQEELDAAMTYYEKLKPDCVDNKVSYEDKARMRAEEIQSLKEALKILNSEDSLL